MPSQATTFMEVQLTALTLLKDAGLIRNRVRSRVNTI